MNAKALASLDWMKKSETLHCSCKWEKKQEQNNENKFLKSETIVEEQPAGPLQRGYQLHL